MPEPRTAARMTGIAPFHVMESLARAQALEAAGCDIIHLEIGEPDFATPAPIVHPAAGGAFYLYADCSAHTGDSVHFAQALLEQVGVAVTPGLDFGQHQPQRYLRITYTQPLPRLVEASARIDHFLRT
jgi:aspartate/methionine/tyrosine aminotransferase